MLFMEIDKLVQSVSDVRDSLMRSSIQAKERAEIGRQNEEKALRINEELKQRQELKESLCECVNYVVRIYKNIEKYSADRKELSMEMLKNAIREAGFIVPDAKTEGIELKVVDKAAKVVDKQGQDINMREGSALRTVLGMLIRYTLLKAQPDSIQALFLDEAFNTLSDNTIMSLREYIEAFKDDTLILGIEQHNTLFAGMPKTVFRAVKDENGITSIIRDGVV